MDGLAETIQGILGSEEGQQQIKAMAEMLGLSGEEPSAPSPSALLPEGLPDPAKLMQMAELFRSVSAEDENTVFLRSLRPLLQPERRTRVDRAIKMLRLVSLLPLLKEQGLLQDFLGDF